MLRVKSGNSIHGFTEFEEDIHFDEDDPDFDQPGRLPTISVPFIITAQFSFLFRIFEPQPVNDETQKLPANYWVSKTSEEIIILADELFQRGEFLEVYHLLNRLKFSHHVEVQWRIGRALFKLARDDSRIESKREMIREAYEIMDHINLGLVNNSEVYKWCAIIFDAKNGMDSLTTRVENFPIIKEYLLKAIELNPKDSVSLYILGKYCFEMSRMSLFQRCLVRICYGKLPSSTFEEAYDYLFRCFESCSDSYYVPNYYLLGETCYHMNQYYRARFYLNAAATLPPRTTFEKRCATKAKILLKRLDIYDLSKETILFEYPF